MDARGLLAGVVVCALAAPGSAAAATRHAAPAGGGSECTSAAPCAIGTALDSAASGDEVLLAPGSYGTRAAPLTGQLTVNGGVTLRGPGAGPRAQIFMQSFIGVLGQANSVLRDLDIENAGQSYALTTYGTAAARVRVDRVRSVTPSPDANAACVPYGAVVTNSVCFSPSGFGIFGGTGFGPGDRSYVLRNTTVVGGNTGMSVNQGDGSTVHAVVVNSVVRGGGQDVTASESNGSQTSVTLESSNYADTFAGPGTTVTTPGSGTNQTEDPGFLDSSQGDLRPAVSSPLVDAGQDDPGGGLLDLEGNLRVQRAAVDIGAFELPAPPTASGLPPERVESTSARLRGSVSNGAAAGSVRFEYGPTTAYGSSTGLTVGPAGAPQVVAALADRLPPNSRVHWRLVASNRGGAGTTPDATFITPPASISSLKISRRRFPAARKGGSIARRKRTGATVSYRSPQSATTTFTVVQSLRGYRVGKKCRRKLRRGQRRAARCRLRVRRGSFRHRSQVAVNRFRFTGRVRRRALKPGSYRLTGAPSVGGRTAPAKSITFKIVR